MAPSPPTPSLRVTVEDRSAPFGSRQASVGPAAGRILEQLKHFLARSRRRQRTGAAAWPLAGSNRADRRNPPGRNDAALSPWESPTDKRRFRRWLIEVSAYLEVESRFYYVTLTDITPSGARARLLEARLFAEDAEAVLDLEGFGCIPAEIRHGVAGVLGLKFILDDERQMALATWLVDAHLQRRHTRYVCRIPALLALGAQELSCVVTDLSRSGAGIQLPDVSVLASSSEVMLTLPDHRPIATIVRHVSEERVGLMFVDSYEGELPPAETAATKRPASD
jgi:PilZ domain